MPSSLQTVTLTETPFVHYVFFAVVSLFRKSHFFKKVTFFLSNAHSSATLSLSSPPCRHTEHPANQFPQQTEVLNELPYTNTLLATRYAQPWGPAPRRPPTGRLRDTTQTQETLARNTKNNLPTGRDPACFDPLLKTQLILSAASEMYWQKRLVALLRRQRKPRRK